MSLSNFTPANTGAFRIYLNNIRKSASLTEEQMDNLLEKYHKTGDVNARNKVVESSQLYVLSVAKTYLTGRFDLQDLIQEGNIGLITAADYYNPNLGIPFIVYATFWIRKYISDFVRRYRTIFTMPTRCKDKVEVEDIDKPMSDDEYCTLEGTLTDDETNPYEEAEQAEYAIQLVRRALNTLTPNERVILCLSYGIDCHPEQDETIAGKLGYKSTERVRQIRNIAIRKLNARIKRV